MIAVHAAPRKLTVLGAPRVTQPDRAEHLHPTVEIKFGVDLTLVIDNTDDAEALESAARVAVAKLRAATKGVRP